MSTLNARIFLVHDLPEHDKITLSEPDLVQIDPQFLLEPVLHADTGPDAVKAERQISSHSVDWGTQAYTVMERRRVYERTNGFVWHIVARKGMPKKPWYERVEAFLNQNDGTTAMIYGLIVVPFIIACAYVFAVLEDLPALFAFLLRRIDGFAMASIVVITLIFAAPFVWAGKMVRGLAVVLMMVPGLMLTKLVLSAIPRPHDVPALTDADYVTAFIAGVSDGVSGWAPILPFIAFVLQLLGLSIVQKLLTDTTALTAPDGVLAKGSLGGGAGRNG